MLNVIPEAVIDYICGKTQQEIRDEYSLTYAELKGTLDRHLSQELQTFLESQNYRESKLGELNPGSKGAVSDGKGYLMMLKPDWYTGRKCSRYVFQHHVVMCEHLGILAVPAGFHVHHINGVKTDNRISNLALLEAGAHIRLHNVERATTIPKGSRGESNPRSASHSSPNKGE
jgi:HNH endonuclease